MDNETAQAVKKQLLLAVRKGFETGTISREEILATMGAQQQAANAVAPTPVPSEASGSVSRLGVVQVLQYVGGFIVLLGIGTFVATFWNDIDATSRVMISGGGAVLAYVLGVILMRVDKKSHSGVAFHLIAGCLFPFAFFVAMNDLLGVDITSQIAMIISLTLLIMYGASYAVFRHLIFTFFALAAGISLIYSGINVIIPDISYEMLATLTFVIGMIGIYIGYAFRGTENEPLAELMYFLGSAAAFIAAAVNFNSAPMWQFLYPFLIAGMLYLALALHSKRILTVSVLALMGYVIYLTGEYFADVVGWPIALVVTGLLLIAIGYGAVKYKEKI